MTKATCVVFAASTRRRPERRPNSAIEGGRTRVKLTVRAAGEMQEGWGSLIEEVWQHFLVEQFKPYAEAKLKP